MSSVDPDIIPPDEAERLAAVHRYEILDTPPDGAFDRITALASRLFDVPVSIVSIVDEDRIWFKSHHGVDATEVGRDPGLCASAVLHEDARIVPDARADPTALANPLVAGEFGLRFYAGAPLRTADGHRLGTLCVIDTEPREVTEAEARTLTDLAAVVVDEMELRLAARNAVRREAELRDEAQQTVRVLQESLLPHALPEVPGLELASFYEPANRGEIGGDFYDLLTLGRDRLAVVMGDICGKGPRAAAATALARHTVRAAATAEAEPGDVLQALNRAMLASPDVSRDRYCTVAYLVVERTAGGARIAAANAGHPPPLIVAPDGAVRELAVAGPLAGWWEDVTFPTTRAELRVGEALILYTDGVTDATIDGAPVGQPGLARVLAEVGHRPAHDIAAAVRGAIDRTGPLRDDAALLVLKVPA